MQETQPNPPSRPGTPPQPPYSPVTPVLTHIIPFPNPSNGTIMPPATSPSPTSQVFSYNSSDNNNNNLPPSALPRQTQTTGPPPTFAPEPSPVPISETDNPDAIALRSAISILQLQKQQSLRDIRTLERMKRVVADDPEGFARELAAGKLSRADRGGGFIDFSHEDGADQGDDEDAEEKSEGEGEGVSGLGTLPTPQNVVRMPHVNWAKYQVVGEPLDRMHEEQRSRPSAGEPRRDESALRAPEYVLASPYRPLVDKLESPTRTKGSKNKKS